MTDSTKNNNIDFSKLLYDNNKFKVISVAQNFEYLCVICNKMINASTLKIKFLNDNTINYVNFNYNQVSLPIFLNTEEFNIYTLDQKVYVMCNDCYSHFIEDITKKQLKYLKLN